MFESDEFDLDEDVEFPCDDFISRLENNNSRNKNNETNEEITPRKVEINSVLAKNTPLFKRKFPGPAGILPLRPNIQENNTTNSNNNLNKNLESDSDNICSQYNSIFESNAWKCASNDLNKINLKDINNFNISHLKRTAFFTNSKAMKYPFLYASILSLDIGQKLFVTLKDSTGDIQAYINSEVVEEFAKDLKRNSVIVLKNVGVLKKNQTRRFFLLVTKNNILTIYPDNSNTSRLSLLKEHCSNIDFDVNSLNNALNTSTLNSSLDTSLNLRSPISNNNIRSSNLPNSPCFSSTSLDSPKSFLPNNISHKSKTLFKKPENISSSLIKETNQSNKEPNQSKLFHPYKVPTNQLKPNHNVIPLQNSMSINKLKTTRNDFENSSSSSFQPKCNNSSSDKNNSIDQCSNSSIQNLDTRQCNMPSSNSSVQNLDTRQCNMSSTNKILSSNNSFSYSVLSQNGINETEDLSKTVINLFDGIDTDSMFGDF